MEEFDHSNTILVVKPVGPIATDSLRSEHNASRLASFHFDDAVSTFSLYDDSRSRECTPYFPPPAELELHLRFDPEPKDPKQGFVFGTNEDICDVVILDDGEQSISREHFYLDFNWDSGYLRVNNISRHGTGISAPSVKNGFQMLKHNNQRMLHPAEQTRVSVGSLKFDFSFPVRGQHHGQLYQRNWEEFRAKCVRAVPGVGGLNIKSPLEVTRFKVLRTSRHHTYLLHDVIGRGEFGTVCKATDERTARLYAAKQFTTTKSGWDAKAYLEIALSQKITHEHIVNFVDSIDDGGGLVLVMDYMPEGNLMQVHLRKKISSDETRTVLRQTLRALAYLHDEKKITHRDIKPANILVRSRTPELFIKLCDFGLSTEKQIQETCCGTLDYAAAEIYERSYSNAVDIWAIGVVALQFIKGLPKHGPKETPLDWCENIRRRLERVGQQIDDPMVSLLKRMLELKPLDRLSAQACLADPWMRSLQQCSQSGTESSVGETKCLEAISEQPTQILDPLWPVADSTKVLGQPTIMEEPRKRSRYAASHSETPGATKPQKKHRTRNDEDEATEVSRVLRKRDYGGPTPESLRQGLPRVYITRGQTGKKVVEKHTTPHAKLIPPTGEDTSCNVPNVSLFMRQTVADADAEHLRLKLDKKVVLMRKKDCMINATQIISLAEKTPTERKYILGLLKKYTYVEILPAAVGSPYPSSWVNFQHGMILSAHLGLEEKLQPLLHYGLGLQSHRFGIGTKELYDFLTEVWYDISNVENSLTLSQKQISFCTIHVHSKAVLVRKPDFRVNATQILAVVGLEGQLESLKQEHAGAFDIVSNDEYHKGTYVDYLVAVGLCREHGLTELGEEIRSLRPASHSRTELEEELRAIRPVSQNPAELEDELCAWRAVSRKLAIEPIVPEFSVPDGQPIHPLSAAQFLNRLPESRLEASVSGRLVTPDDAQSRADMSESGVALDKAIPGIAHAPNRLCSPPPIDEMQSRDTRSHDCENQASSRPESADTNSSQPQGMDRKSCLAGTSYYSYRDFEPRNSELTEVKLSLQRPSKASSRYGSNMDTSHSFLVAMQNA